MRYHVAIITKSGNIVSKNCQTLPEADDFILTVDNGEGVKRADILNKETGKREVVNF